MLFLEQEDLYTFDHYFGSQRRADEGEVSTANQRDFAEDGGFLCPSGKIILKNKHLLPYTNDNKV